MTLRARWVTLRSRWVTLRARWVTHRERGRKQRHPLLRVHAQAQCGELERVLRVLAVQPCRGPRASAVGKAEPRGGEAGLAVLRRINNARFKC